LLEQSLIVVHIGRDWIWKRDNKETAYWQILRMFQDRKNSLYSLHQIGQWMTVVVDIILFVFISSSNGRLRR
jgi:hypothetical protein